MRSRFLIQALCAIALALLVPAGAEAQGSLRCQELTFPVTLSPDDEDVYDVFGILCSRGGIQNKTFQITLHGSTYSHLYWDWPFQPAIYSYVRYATTAGYAVLNLDRIGIGRSDRPPAADVTIESNAYVVHQIVQALRGGELVVPTFGRVRAQRVVLVGHSLGSVISIQEAATYDDVDGVVLTGVTHTVTPALGELALHPASLDPRFAGVTLPEGYLTTVPGTRSIFYNPPFYNPRVLALDEQTKETTTPGELETAVPGLAFSSGIHVPVLVVVGDNDRAFCTDPSCLESGSIYTEPTFYPEDTCARAIAIPGAGHDLNLHFQAPFTYLTMLQWINRRVGRNPAVPPPFPCEP